MKMVRIKWHPPELELDSETGDAEIRAIFSRDRIYKNPVPDPGHGFWNHHRTGFAIRSLEKVRIREYSEPDPEPGVWKKSGSGNSPSRVRVRPRPLPFTAFRYHFSLSLTSVPGVAAASTAASLVWALRIPQA